MDFKFLKFLINFIKILVFKFHNNLEKYNFLNFIFNNNVLLCFKIA